jgi:hypothetical protein
VDLTVEGERLTGTITLPRGLTGSVTWQRAQQQLNGGVQTIAPMEPALPKSANNQPRCDRLRKENTNHE